MKALLATLSALELVEPADRWIHIIPGKPTGIGGGGVRRKPSGAASTTAKKRPRPVDGARISLSDVARLMTGPDLDEDVSDADTPSSAMDIDQDHCAVEDEAETSLDEPVGTKEEEEEELDRGGMLIRMEDIQREHALSLALVRLTETTPNIYPSASANVWTEIYGGFATHWPGYHYSSPSETSLSLRLSRVFGLWGSRHGSAFPSVH